MWRVAGPVTVATESELAPISLSCGRNHLWKCNWRSHAFRHLHPLVWDCLALPFMWMMTLAVTRHLRHLHPLLWDCLALPFYADDDLQNMGNIPVIGMSPTRGGGFEEVLSDGDGLAASTVSSALAPVVECDAPAVTTAYRVRAAPAPVVEYDAPAPNMAYRGTCGTCSRGHSSTGCGVPGTCGTCSRG